jgi:exosortase/archaeosortase family protein
MVGLDRAAIDALLIAGQAGILEFLRVSNFIPEPAFARTIRYHRRPRRAHLLWIGDPCNGVGLFAVYLIFLVAYPGPVAPQALVRSPGSVSIHLINAIRVAAFASSSPYDYELLNFNHDYTFYVVVYGWVFLLWAIWVKKFAPNSTTLPRHEPQGGRWSWPY